MIDFDRWDIITALFPFVDSLARKPRPVLVLSHSAFNRSHAHLHDNHGGPQPLAE